MGSIKINYEGKTESHEMEALPKQPEGGGGGCEIIELTQKEYDDLPDTKLTDGKLYKIKDANINGDATTVTYVESDGNKTNVADELDKINNSLSELNSNLNYTTEEHIVGKYIDGKNVYEKTFSGDFTTNTTNSRTTCDLDIPCDGTIIKVEGMIKTSLGSYIGLGSSGMNTDGAFAYTTLYYESSTVKKILFLVDTTVHNEYAVSFIGTVTYIK